MAYDEGLADRIRRLLAGHPLIGERKMFGGIAFLRGGHMFAGVSGSSLMARVGKASYVELLGREHVREMDFTGKPMQGYVYVDPPGLEGEAELRFWVEHCESFVAALPPKKGT
ncbi:MAG: TfoX/Sxy family protein [Acidobacteria bacterium]|nr:TfoX/Sxy family protein [Acidobacteriota bacterium]